MEGLRPDRGSIPIRLVVFATLLNVAVVAASFHQSGALAQNDPQEGFWPFVFSHANDFSTVLIALFNGLLYLSRIS